MSVVMACRNPGPVLAEQLDALASQDVDVPWELVVSLNGSTDGSAQLLETFRERLPALVVVDSSERRGPSAARNAGVRAAAADRLVFCDADDVVAPGWLSAMAAALEDQELVAARLEHDRLNEPWTTRTRATGSGLQASMPPWLPYAYGAVLGAGRALHDKVGGFDESLLAGEDREYCYRAQLAGAQLVLVEDAVVHYRHRSDSVALYRQSRDYAYAHVRIYRDYRHLGLGRPSPARGAVAWVVLLARLPRALASRPGRALWMSRLGWRVGRLRASLDYRVFAL